MVPAWFEGAFQVIHKEGFAAVQDGLEFFTLVSGAVSSPTVLAQQVWGAELDPRYYPEKRRAVNM